MTASLLQLNTFASSFYTRLFTGSVADWCCQNLRFDEAQNRGPFTLDGREYMREPLNDWGDPDIGDCVEVFGSQTGKTAMLMGGICWSVVCDPCGMLWVMPSETLAQSFSNLRLRPMLEASAATEPLIPRGARRHSFKTLEMQIGASVINLIGSNSPSNLASRPVRKVILDEVDKFNFVGGNHEAGAVNLAEQRTKGQAYAQRRKTSTPSMTDAPIWQEFLKGDQRRFFVPCPHCGKSIVFAWSERFTILKKTGCESFVRWDSDAKHADGSWNFEKVQKSARIECCFCQGHIQDGLKTRMIRSGEWRPTATSDRGFRSRHLSSLYASSPETTFGKLAVRFLQQKQSREGLQGFINGDLAEPYESQDSLGKRTELITAHIVSADGAVKLMQIDCQAKAPYFWYIVRSWSEMSSQLLGAGHCDTWEEISTVQAFFGVPNVGVWIDSGWGARADAGVYRECAKHSELIGPSLCIGWNPCKGFPQYKRWKDSEKGLMLPYYLTTTDPLGGTVDAGVLQLNIFEFASPYFRDILEDLRNPKTSRGFEWSVCAEAFDRQISDGIKTCPAETYWKHLDGQIKAGIKSRKRSVVTSWEWTRRHSDWPDHLCACENQGTAVAAFLGKLPPTIFEPKKSE